jgi:NAD(P)-dependent dehydrogenase (short-subunit alcohol dehydrogenase family)
MPIDKPLQDRVAVITGASRGLGRAIALALGEQGAALALLARDRTRLESVVAEASAQGMAAECLVCDVTVEDQVAEVRDRIRERFGRVHILVNNAGTNVRKAITEFTLAEWRQVLDTSLTGAFLLCRALIPLMQGTGYGRILNLTSIMSHVALAGRSAYAASKAGLLGFTKALALELAPSGITVNGISPGPVATEMNQPILANPALHEQFTSRIPLGRWGTETEIARLAVYLCSADAGWITGTDVLADGGWTAQ